MLSRRLISKFLFLTLVVVSTSCKSIIEVDIPQGRLHGKEEISFTNKVYNSFRGIPYAKPPVSQLRFQPPKPHLGWQGTYAAYESKQLCLQYNSRMRNGEQFGISGSEDCLYLNVYTASLKSSQPVVVFDYNDNFKSGFNETTYLPDFMLSEDVVVITVSYRLSPLGYLTTQDKVIPANNGIRDFILALKWIQENIKHFGGDPNNVTLMGSRGGAVLVDLLLYSEKAKGLFHKVILQSGTALEPIFLNDDARKSAFEMGSLFNITTDDPYTLLKKLQEVDAEEILNNEGKISREAALDLYQMSVLPFTPVIEEEITDAVITYFPEKSKIVNDVPILIGFNSREGLDLTSPSLYEPRLLQDISYDNFLVHFPIRTSFRFDNKALGFERVIQEIWDFYFQIGYVSPDNAHEYAVYMGDILQNYALNLAAKKLAAEAKSPVYFYMFDFRGMLNENSQYMSRRVRSSMKPWGATIGDELCFLFLCGRIKSTYKELKDLPSEQPEMKTLNKMVRLWTNFMKTGNPTPSENDNILKGIKWTPMNKDSTNEYAYLHITRKPSMKNNPLEKRYLFWNNFLEKYSNVAENGVVNKFMKDEL